MSFATEQIELSLCSPETGLPLTAHVYTLENVTEADGITLRKMSIGQLVMALCLQRAADLEKQVVQLMDSINQNSTLLGGLSDVEQQLVAVSAGHNFTATNTFSCDGTTTTYYDFLKSTAGISDLPALDADEVNGNKTAWTYNTVQAVITLVENKMDSLNTVSQDTLIQLQSLTTKRDQTYDLVSNVLKSLHTVLAGNANNL